MTCCLVALGSEPLLKHLTSKPCLLLQRRPFHALCWLKLAVEQTNPGSYRPQGFPPANLPPPRHPREIEKARMFLSLCAFLGLQDIKAGR